MKKVILTICLCTNLMVLSSFAQVNKAKPNRNSKISKINSLIESYADNFLFNGSVLVEEKGKVIFKKGYGSANLEWNIPNAADTKFRIGSITKQFTAVMILQLEQEGKLNINAKVTDYLPWYRKDTGGKITVKNLLKHTSGIPNYTAVAGAMNDIAAHNYSPKEIAEKFCSGDLEFESGTNFSYDNSGYFLLGVIVEAVTKKTYAENLTERIFAPLKMKNSGIDSPFVLLKNRAAGYEYGFRGYENTAFINMESAIYAAGAIYSTVEDLNLWENALYGNKLLSKENKTLMFTPTLGNYGTGLFIGKFKPAGISAEVTSIGHHGGINGFSALLIRFVEAEITVILLDNTRAEKRGNLENISLGIFQILNDVAPAKPKQPIRAAMTEKIRAGKSGEELAAFYRQIKNERKDGYDLTGAENLLNDLGYFLLENGRIKDSLAVLKMAVEEFPNSANTFDSYAEALMKDGQKDAAIKNYKYSLALNPNNKNAVEQLKTLELKP
jgi:CubicO group peptidase (beta-lactamase class C family)